MAPMYDEDEDLWTGGALSKKIAQERLDQQQAAERAANAGPSAGDRILGGLKGAVSGAATGFQVGGPWGAAVGGLAGGGLGAATAQKSEATPTASQAEEGVKLGKSLFNTDKMKALKEVEDNPMLDLSDADLAP